MCPHGLIEARAITKARQARYPSWWRMAEGDATSTECDGELGDFGLPTYISDTIRALFCKLGARGLANDKAPVCMSLMIAALDRLHEMISTHKLQRVREAI